MMARASAGRAGAAVPFAGIGAPAPSPSPRVIPNERPAVRHVIVASAVLEALTLVAALAWWPVYESTAFLLLATVTVTAGTVLAAVAALGRWPGPAVAVSVVALWLVLGVPLAVPAKALAGVLPTIPGLTDLAITTVTGWRQLLTIEIPVGDYQALLVPAFVLLVVASVIGTSVACRVVRPAGRVLAVIPAAVVLIAGLAFGGSTGFAPLAVGGGFAVLVVIWLTIVGSANRRGAARRSTATRIAAAAGVMALALVAAVAVTAVLPAPERSALRDTVEQPFEPGDYASPLAGYRAYLKDPVADSVVLTVTGAPAGSRIAVARMDDYDGVVFSVGGADGTGALFTRVPERLAQSTGGTSVTARIEVGDYAGAWVPTFGDPLAVRFTGADAAALQNSLFFSPALSTVATTQGLAAGDGYELSADSPAAAGAETAPPLTSLTPGAGVVALPTPGVVPDAVSSRAAEWAPESASPGERLAGIVAGLTSGYVSSGLDGQVYSRSGHGADRIQELLTATPMVGDAEQYAAAGALLAEAAGFPARVALGFVLPSAGEEASVTSGTVTDSGAGTGTDSETGTDVTADAGSAAASATGPVELHGRDATAWVEVYTAESGWTALDVTPEPRPIPEKPITDDSTAVQPPQVVPPAGDDLDDQVQSAPLQQDDPDQTPDGGLLATVLRIAAIVGITLAGLAILLAPFLTVIALKARRRTRRRERGSPRDRAAGSWNEVVDAARDADLAPPRHSTRREAARAIGGIRSVRLADQVDGALYSPEPPDEGQLAALWAASDEERHRLQHEHGWFSRLRMRVSPRSLRDPRRRADPGRTYHGGSETKRRLIR